MEVFVPRGAIYWAALLGARFEPNDGGTLEVEVHIGRGRAAQTISSAICSSSNLSVEMIPEYARAILAASVHHLQGAVTAGSGRLSFCASATDNGSSELVFRRLSIAVCRAIFDGGATTWSEILAQEFFRKM